jgi:hypothetical protein
VSVEEGRELLLRVASDPDLAARLAEPTTSIEDKQSLLAELGFRDVSCPDVDSAAAALSQHHADLLAVQDAATSQGMDVAQLLQRAHDIAAGFCTGGAQ